MKWLKLFEDFSIDGLNQNFGKGKTFTNESQKEYEILKKNPKVYWGVYDIDNDQFIAKSNNYQTLIEGASVPKSIAAALSVCANSGKIISEEHATYIKGLLVRSVNSYWAPIQTIAGGGKKLDEWTNKMGWSTMKPQHNSRKVNVEGMCLFWADTLNNKYPGAEIIKKISNGVATSSRRSRVYLPKDCRVGTKTGTWNTRTGDMHDSGWIIMANGRRFAITVLTKLFNEEKIALMWGGLYREYCINPPKVELKKDFDITYWQPKSGVVFLPIHGHGEPSEESKTTWFGRGEKNYPWIGIPKTMTPEKQLIKFVVISPKSKSDFERIFKLIKDNRKLDSIRPNTVILLTWGNQQNQQTIDEDLEIARNHLGVKLLENLPDNELKLVQDSI